MRATVICPTHNHGRLIHASLRSVLRQTHEDFEVFVIGDGVTDETRDAVNEALGWDGRIQFVDREKSERHGEPYRHEVLRERASGEFVCYICDDDLWMPHHLALMSAVLDGADVAHSRNARVLQDGTVSTNFVDWSAAGWRAWMVDPPLKNGVGLSQGGHRMDFYHRLPHGWRTTPKGRWSDHYMWCQMLQMPDVRAVCTRDASVIQFPSPLRTHMSVDERYDEVCAWVARMEADPAGLRAELNRLVADWEASRIAQYEAERADIKLLRGSHSTMKIFQKAVAKACQDRADLTRDLAETHREGALSLERKRVEVEKLKAREAGLRQELEQEREQSEKWWKLYERVPRWIRRMF